MPYKRVSKGEATKGRIGLSITLRVKHAPHLDALLLNDLGATAIDALSQEVAIWGRSKPRRTIADQNRLLRANESR